MGELLSDLVGREAILQRTAEGQRALVFEVPGLEQSERQLLGVLTGHTPLLVFESFGLDARLSAARLLSRGLASRVLN